ncbi:MAG: hypothetical protein K9W45_12465 [Candidatus Heimdallarchaeum aukensis]|uniref:Uncharacterized protein n=1 Tax=Candidatus Heimdallarchaeum aukensis TaxID=2876573 RepID=A0A9Y1FLB6_9ARCH|nr:MAG: hypothetical protein K9W45_12465 [Candidatus Heimdallarchaeum aukensis]
MPSEYVMYLSIIMIGSLAIAGISATMVSLNNSLENRAIESSLEQILQKVANSILDLKQFGDKKIQQGATDFTIQLSLSLPDKIQEEEYVITYLLPDSATEYLMYAYLVENEDVSATVTLYLEKSEVTFSGEIVSSQKNPIIAYLYDGTNKRITFSSGV